VNIHDRAIVVGISRYADANANPPWIRDLKGPDLDAQEIAAWLRQPSGGGLPKNNVRVISSANFPPASIGPQRQAILAEFDALKKLPTTALPGGFAGRRLWMYVAGHGFASARRDAALITAEATRQNRLNVWITNWFNWFLTSGRFQQYVLWVDTCATREATPLLTPCPWREEFAQNPDDISAFIAFAARLGKTAVEAPLEGRWRGVFTYALLKALGGAAGTPVRSAHLEKYLHNSLTTFMTDEQRNDDRVGHEPAFVETDDLDFGTPAPSKFTVTLRFPQECVGMEATLSIGAGTAPIARTTLQQQAEWIVHELDAGGYAAYVPELNRTFGFGVTGGEEVVITLH
jgi:uncharacterized caspase-like protein